MFGNNQSKRMGNVLWFAILIWFSSSLLSQALYIGLHGIPYDAVELFGGVGPAYYLLVGIELVMWALLAGFSITKMSRRMKIKHSSMVPSLGK